MVNLINTKICGINGHMTQEITLFCRVVRVNPLIKCMVGWIIKFRWVMLGMNQFIIRLFQSLWGMRLIGSKIKSWIYRLKKDLRLRVFTKALEFNKIMINI